MLAVHGAALLLFVCAASCSEDHKHLALPDDTPSVDPPHVPAAQIYCTTCHDPQDFTDKGGSTRCLRCHDPGGLGVAAPANVHASAVVGTKYGSWAMECVDCHDPHMQLQGAGSKLLKETLSGSPLTALLPSGVLNYASGSTYDGICDSCHTQTTHHRNNASGSHLHQLGNKCTDCHLHADGFKATGKCGDCHGVPPNTGAHQVHFSGALTDATYGGTEITSDYPSPSGYVFNCGNCHPSDPAQHMNGTVDLELHDPAAGGIKALHPATAAYTPGATVLYDTFGLPYSDGSCSDVYCHSSGQEFPTYVATPSWSSTFATPKCSQCHANPPNYASVGAGAVVANSHLVMATDGYELGHFGGLPGPWHTSYHGVAWADNSSPITCQTCHYDTVDSTNTGPGGFYYLDTTGNYDLGGALGYDCTTCHTGAPADPPQGSGKVLPSPHVNGMREVAFDPRTSIPASVTGLPAGSRPTYPYWVTAAPTGAVPLFSVKETIGIEAGMSLHLGSAVYDPVQKSCSNVACHLKQSFGTGDPAFDPLRWGKAPAGSGWAFCNSCHQY